MTKARRATLEVLEQTDRPLSANEVSARIRLNCNPVTVYRTLHYLESAGYAESFVLHCTEHGTERYYTAVDTFSPHHHGCHCEQCHTFIDLGDCSITNLITTYERDKGLRVTGHTLYFTGVCPQCARDLPTGTS